MFAGLPRLFLLDISRCILVSDAGVRHIRGLSELHVLNMAGCILLTNDALAAVKCMTRVQSLDVQECGNIGSRGLRHLCSLTHLKWLDVSLCQGVDDEACGFISKITSVADLTMFGCYMIGFAGFVSIGSMAALTTLTMAKTEIEDDDIALLSGLLRLQQLSIDMSAFLYGQGLYHLRDIPGLHSLDISACDNLTDKGVVVGVGSLPHIRSLNVSFCPLLSNTVVKLLSSMPSSSVVPSSCVRAYPPPPWLFWLPFFAPSLFSSVRA